MTTALGNASAHSASQQQPPWAEPAPRTPAPVLCVYNSLTRTKVPFRPSSGDNLVKWYSCGPTVYDAAHLGHARNYMTFDILRRIMQDYFNYDILYIMNITDIDDKIILRARQSFLLKQYERDHPRIDAALLQELEALLRTFVLKKCNADMSRADWSSGAKSGLLADDAKGLMFVDIAVKAQQCLGRAEPGASSAEVLLAFQDILAPHLDELKGATVDDPKVSRDLAAFWEADFLSDMQQLGVLPADIMTRVSEFIPEIIEYVQGIMTNGFAYVTDEGSVYFDVAAFKSSGEHHYAKLCPWNAGNAKFFEEGEGALGMQLSGKRDPRDFALWKASKAGEPFWESPWGRGRPGWHIECSAMAGSVAPGVLDVHSGGIDLAFPHHDNELAQSEAYTGCSQWVNYFLHAGHVHIEGHKMSKSLKNFITIKECLQRYSARQLRFMFLQHHWSSPVTYKESSMVNALSAESAFVNFFTNTNQHAKEFVEPGNGDNNFGAAEKALMAFTDMVKARVHAAFCDSFDTPAVLSALLDLVNKCNVYHKQQGAKASPAVLLYAGRYVGKILGTVGITGLCGSTAAKGVDDHKVAVILDAISVFRDKVRDITKAADSKPRDYFAASDSLRSSLAKVGVVFEDRPHGLRSIVKLVEHVVVGESNPADGAVDGELAKKTAEMTIKQADRAAAKAAKAKVPPSELFKDNPAYSRFDERGIPTHDAAGEEVSKSARKKLVKEYELQVDLFASYNNSTKH